VFTAAGTVQVKTGKGILGRLVVSAVGTTATVNVYDDTGAGTSNLLWSWATADGKLNQWLDVPFDNGLKVVVTGTSPTIYITWS